MVKKTRIRTHEVHVYEYTIDVPNWLTDEDELDEYIREHIVDGSFDNTQEMKDFSIETIRVLGNDDI